MITAQDRWLTWAREIQAQAQTGLHYARKEFEEERAQGLLDIAAEIVADYSELTIAEAKAAFSAQPGYVTPKIDVRAAVFDQDKLLMVQEAIDDSWTLPGGWADVGEAPSLAVEREVLEETGIEVKADGIIGVYDANRVEDALELFHAYKILFSCVVISGELKTSKETTQVGFFPPDDLPEPLSAYRTPPRILQDAIRVNRGELDQVVFD
jgi:ADP-ribose pyrophosphatase YjhB (NUDIX family)